jgi:serine/threonine-protein kinase
MAEVYVARRTGARGFTKNVGLKRILPQFASDPEFVAMFIDEARVGSSLSHPNLVEVFDFGEDQGELFMAMELVDGTTCARLVRAAAGRGEAVPVEDTLFIVLNVLRGLEYAHDATDEQGNLLGLVHRDVSPGNVLVSRTGAVKLADFGIVRAAHLDRRPDQGQLKGKLGYMSPEQVLGQELDRRSDLFTLGIIMAELLVGRPLFSHGAEVDILLRIRDADSSVFSRNAAHLPDDLKAVVYRALARDVVDRFQTAGAFAEAIEAIIRRRRLILGPTRLSAYLETLGLVKPATRSGEFRAGGALDSARRPHVAAQRGHRSSPPPSVVPGSPLEAPARPVTYRLTLADGALTDPLPLARVLEALVSGRVATDAPVSRDNGPFAPAREHPELRRVTTSSAHRWDQHQLAPAGAAHHPVDPRTLPALLFRLALDRETVMILAQSGSQRKKIYLADGFVEYASSTNSDQLLGERLLRDGLILPVELDMALALAPRYGGRIGDALVGLGILRPIEVFRALYEQIRGRAVELLGWRQGDVWVVKGVRSHEEILPQGLLALEVWADAIARSFTEDELLGLLEPIRPRHIGPGPRSSPCVSALRLGPGATRTLLAVEAPVVLDELLASVTASGQATLHEALVAVFTGLSAGSLLAEGGWPPQATPGAVASGA